MGSQHCIAFLQASLACKAVRTKACRLIILKVDLCVKASYLNSPFVYDGYVWILCLQFCILKTLQSVSGRRNKKQISNCLPLGFKNCTCSLKDLQGLHGIVEHGGKQTERPKGIGASRKEVKMLVSIPITMQIFSIKHTLARVV